MWTGLGGLGVARKIEEAVRQALTEFEPLQLNPVDETVACYGRALRVLCEHWPVLDGDEPVGPLRAMNEASRVVAEHQIRRITQGRLSVSDLDPETAMTLTLFGIWGLGELAYDEALNLSRSLNIALSERPSGYRVEGRMVGINRQAEGGGAEAGERAPKKRVLRLRWFGKDRSSASPNPKNEIPAAWSSRKRTGMCSMG